MVLRLRGLILCGVVLCAGGSAVAQEASTASAEPLTLNQVIALAQENHRLSEVSQQSVLQASDPILAVRTQRYPPFNVPLKLVTRTGPSLEGSSTDSKGEFH